MLSLCCRNGFFLTKSSSPPSSINVPELLETVTGYGPLGAALRRNLINEWEYSTISTSFANVHPVHSPITSEMVTPTNGGLHWLKAIKFPLPFGLSYFTNSPPMLYNRELLHLYYFCPSSLHQEWILFWQRRRLKWWKQLAHRPESFVLESTNDTSSVIKYVPPVVEQEQEKQENIIIENIDSFQLEDDGDNTGIHFTTRLDAGIWSVLTDAFLTNYGQDDTGLPPENVILKLHRRLAPVTVGLIPEDKSQDQAVFCNQLTQELNIIPISARCYEEGSVESRLAYLDEIGTPFRVLLDNDTLTEGLLQFLDRDARVPEQIDCETLLYILQGKFRRYKDLT